MEKCVYDTVLLHIKNDLNHNCLELHQMIRPSPFRGPLRQKVNLDRKKPTIGVINRPLLFSAIYTDINSGLELFLLEYMKSY